ncbi:MAG: hypothetical protein SGI77_00245 [Pirellulaceae bacterium]|nr:hypothetical protein [Pirellulaceae bacterium]
MQSNVVVMLHYHRFAKDDLSVITADFEFNGSFFYITVILSRFFDAHPRIRVHCNALTDNENSALREALDETELAASGISPTTIRLAIGNEDSKDLIAQFIQSARFAIEPHLPGFTAQFPSAAEIDKLVYDCYVDGHRRYIESKAPMAEYLS